MSLSTHSRRKWQNALALRRKGAFQEAEKELKEALEEQPHHPLLNASLAQLYLKQDRIKEARILAESILSQELKYPQALYVLGEVYFHEEHWGDALRCFQQAHMKDPSAYLVQGVIKTLKKMGRHRDALETVDAALMTDRDNIGLLKEKALILDHMKLSDKALQIYERVKELAPGDSFVMRAVFKLKSLKRPTHEVIQELQKILSLPAHQDNAELHELLAEKLKRAGRLKDAAAEYKKAHELAPDNVFFIKQEGFCRNRLKEYPEAIRLLGEAFRRDPTDFIVKKTLKKIYALTGDEVGFIRLLEETLQEHPHNVKLMGTLKGLKKKSVV